MAYRNKLRSFILENYLFSDDQSLLTDQDSFLEKGILDSTGILELIFYLEEEFAVAVAEGEMVPDNLDSVDNLVSYLSTKVAA